MKDNPPLQHWFKPLQMISAERVQYREKVNRNFRRQNYTQPPSYWVEDTNMTNLTIWKDRLTTVSTAQKRSKEGNRLLHLACAACPSSCKGPGIPLAKPPAPRAERGALAVCAAQLSAPRSSCSLLWAQWGPGSGGRWQENPQLWNSSQCLTCPPLVSMPHPMQTQLLPVLMILASWQIPHPSFLTWSTYCCLTPSCPSHKSMWMSPTPGYSISDRCQCPPLQRGKP